MGSCHSTQHASDGLSGCPEQLLCAKSELHKCSVHEAAGQSEGVSCTQPLAAFWQPYTTLQCSPHSQIYHLTKCQQFLQSEWLKKHKLVSECCCLNFTLSYAVFLTRYGLHLSFMHWKHLTGVFCCPNTSLQLQGSLCKRIYLTFESQTWQHKKRDIVTVKMWSYPSSTLSHWDDYDIHQTSWYSWLVVQT